MSRARHRFLDELAERFASHGAEPYGEAVSQAEHALQCATLAERAGCSDSLVVAALLHDIGHLYEDPAQIDEEDLRHEEFGARLLRELFPESVWQPVRLHVSAKRFLCAVDPSYHASLSPASRHSLVLQGGPFDERAAAAYIKRALCPGRPDPAPPRRPGQGPGHAHPRTDALLPAAGTPAAD